ncbi:MAG TPA: cytochrome c oxidase subunit II transmembrane domain-containing protein [Candidatus Acidoferrum sp.]|nr:cytochrome c oxidase subunit II transmembrane domain-containing protein [Candidatus Acidoferrum sp.]
MKGAPANPAPAAATHHTALEVAWTVAPAMILAVIAIPSFHLLPHLLRAGMAMTVTASNAIGPIPILKIKVAASNSIPG